MDVEIETPNTVCQHTRLRMGSQSEQNQDLYDYVICGYAFLEDLLSLQSSDLSL